MYPSGNAENTDTDVDIIIVGAGISGMSAAFYILAREPTLKILILEATSRIGGRTLSIPLRVNRNQMHSYDIGGQFISSSQIHLIDLIKKLDLHLVEREDIGKIIWNLEEEVIIKTENKFDVKHFDERIDLIQFFKTIQRMGKNVSFINPVWTPDSDGLDLITMEEFIVANLVTVQAQNFIRHIIRIACGLEPSEITVLFYLIFCKSTDGMENQFLMRDGGAKETWIKEGADQICARMSAYIGKSNIKRNDPVIEITRTSEEVSIETENTTYQCKYVVIAIPPKEILEISFFPLLPPTRMGLIGNIKEGHVIKFVATYSIEFWTNKGFSGNIISCGTKGGHGPIQVCYNTALNNHPSLTGYIAADDCLQQPEESYKNEVLQQLATYFGEEALTPIDYVEKNWLNEPYLYNCYSNSPGMDNMEFYPEIRRPIGRLFWAGTETATYWNGYMGGAVQAGYRAAIEVLYEFRPQTLTTADIQYIYSRGAESRSRWDVFMVKCGRNWNWIYSGVAELCWMVYRYIRNN